MYGYVFKILSTIHGLRFKYQANIKNVRPPPKLYKATRNRPLKETEETREKTTDAYEGEEEIGSSLKCFAKLLKNFLEIIAYSFTSFTKK